MKLAEEVATAVNASFMGMATQAIDTFWMEVNSNSSGPHAGAFVERMIEANHRLHNVQRRYNLPMFWNDVPTELTFLPYGGKPTTHPMFDRIPMMGGQRVIEAGLLLANRRLAVQERFEVSNDKVAVLWVPPEEEKMRAVFDLMRKLDQERNLMGHAARTVVERCVHRPGLNTPSIAVRVAHEVLPVLRLLLPEKSGVNPTYLPPDAHVGMLEGIDMGALMPAIIRLEHFYHVDNHGNQMYDHISTTNPRRLHRGKQSTYEV